jgi:hypothetical protein
MSEYAGNGYAGISMSNNAVTAYNEGKKPLSKITKEDILQYGVTESLAFFKWYVKNNVPHNTEWHHTSPKYNLTLFYDIEECCKSFKRHDLDELKVKYRNRPKPKHSDKIENIPYFAKVRYSVSTRSGSRLYFEVYALIYQSWAYLDDDYRGIIKKRINGLHFDILERYQERPEDMPEKLAQYLLRKTDYNSDT